MGGVLSHLDSRGENHGNVAAHRKLFVPLYAVSRDHPKGGCQRHLYSSMRRKNTIIIGGAVVVLLLLLWGVWALWLSPTKVAFVNYQVISLGQISKANDNSFIKITEVSTDKLNTLGRYDMVFMNAMGLRITEDQRALIQKAADRGLPILTTAATNPANRIISLDDATADTLRTYLGSGGRRNYRSLLNYVRRHIDRKLVALGDIEPVIRRANDLIYHADPENPDEEDLGFNTIAEYNDFLRQNDLYHEGAARIIITGQMGDPTDLIRALEESGNMVYPVQSTKTLIDKQMMDTINPSAVINMAHGRMGDYMVDYLTEQNIPLFCPLNVNRLVEEWEDDKMGMSGGFLSQSVVTPEIDGAIRPFVLFGHTLVEEGLQQIIAIPERLEDFVQTVNNYITLQRKPNSEKRVAIYYYKGPGQNAMTAAGMEVGPSLYNLLVRLRKEGFRVDGLPASSKELERMIQAQGAVFGTYAEGAFDEFMRTGRPALVTKDEYEDWVAKSLRPEAYQEVVEANGEFPGEYMATAEGQLGVARLQFGNVCLLPQNAAGAGDNAFKIVHGTGMAPPHTYIASYLWTRFGFKADALIHFGTHGSLEFTPRKQVALSSFDWPDRLVGTMPHFYIYSIADVGEGMIAKRRSYAGLQSHLTPPFLESNVRGTYRELMEAVKTYNNLLADGSNAEEGQPRTDKQQAALDKASLKVKALAVKMGIHRSLELDSILTEPWGEEDVTRVENFAEELSTEKITGQLYTMGVPYEPARITSSVYAMATDPIAYSLLALDKIRGKADSDVEKHKALFTQRYLNPARDLVTRLLANPALATDALICRTAGITQAELDKARRVEEQRNQPTGMMAMMMAAGSSARPGTPQEAAGQVEEQVRKESAQPKADETPHQPQGGQRPPSGQGNPPAGAPAGGPQQGGGHPGGMPQGGQQGGHPGGMPQGMGGHPGGMPGEMPQQPDSAATTQAQPSEAPQAGKPSGHHGMMGGGSMDVSKMPDFVKDMLKDKSVDEIAEMLESMMGMSEESAKKMAAAIKGVTQPADTTATDATTAATSQAQAAGDVAQTPPQGHPGGQPRDGQPGGMPGGTPPQGPAPTQGQPGQQPQGQPGGQPAGSQPGVQQGAQQSGGMADMMAMMNAGKEEFTKDEINLALAIMEVERTIKNVGNYRRELQGCPESELSSMINALAGGYTVPSPGGDPIVNPNTLPTGRNMYGINAEATPSESAWEKGKLLANNTIDMYRRRHNDSIPRKVSYTLWSGEFIETEGATIAQILYMLGVEPIRDAFGRVTDLRLIPSAELGRPRIDVVVQTSGQLRDIAASRLFLINRAVEMAASATDDEYVNEVNAGVVEAERALIEKGVTPKDAREISTFRVFGAANGGYGTGIQGMVMSGDRWETEQEIADVYLNNMGAYYGSEKNWEAFRQFAFEAALTRTDAVIQPRQSNTWGALSLDHVYEFMGGLNLAVRNVTGKDPDAYLSDYRNRNNFRMQEVKEAIGVESRTTIFNPTYIKEKMKGEASSAGTFAEIIQNTYGWNVMKPKAIDKEMWDEIYEVYIKDKFNLGIQDYFEQQNPAALEEMTAVMLETVRKGMWQASDQQIADIAKLHTDLVNKYKPSCSGFVCDNAKLRQFIASKTEPEAAQQYTQNIDQVRQAAADNKGVVMKKEEMGQQPDSETNVLSNVVVAVVVIVAVIALALLVRHRRKKLNNEQ